MSGEVRVIEPSGIEHSHTYEGKAPSLAMLQKLVHGYITPVKARVGGKIKQAYINEEGLLFGLPVNAAATALCAGDPRVQYQGAIVGNIAIVIPYPAIKKGDQHE